MDASTVVAVAPLTDVSTWARGSGLEIVLIVLGAVLVTRFATWGRDRWVGAIDARDNSTDSLVKSEASKHRHTLVQVLTWVGLVLLYCVAAVLVIQRLGVPITGLVAPATVAGVALGFGAQRVVQDVLAGFFIISERQYAFGDLVKLSIPGLGADAIGTVENVTLRITRIRTSDGEVVTFPNGQIARTTNLSRDWARAVVDVPVPSTVDISRATESLQQVGAEAFADPELRTLLLDAPTALGVEDIEVSEFRIRLVARTLPGKQFVVGRELRARVVAAFRKDGVDIAAYLLVRPVPVTTVVPATTVPVPVTTTRTPQPAPTPSAAPAPTTTPSATTPAPTSAAPSSPYGASLGPGASTSPAPSGTAPTTTVTPSPE